MSGLSAYIWNNTATSKSKQEEGTNGGAERAARGGEGGTEDAKEADHENLDDGEEAKAEDHTSKKSQDVNDSKDDGQRKHTENSKTN